MKKRTTTTSIKHGRGRAGMKRISPLLPSLSVDNDALRRLPRFNHQTVGVALPLIFQLIKPLNSDSLIAWYGVDCKLVSEKNYLVFQNEFKVLIYNYDILSTSDEESYIYYNEKYGCLAIDNYGDIRLNYTIEYDKNSKELNQLIINSIFQNTEN